MRPHLVPERLIPALLLCAIVIPVSLASSAAWAAQQTKGNNCHMEQQCHWENFKKVCVYVKVCR
jgi:hypothetical protein